MADINFVVDKRANKTEVAFYTTELKTDFKDYFSLLDNVTVEYILDYSDRPSTPTEVRFDEKLNSYKVEYNQKVYRNRGSTILPEAKDVLSSLEFCLNLAVEKYKKQFKTE